MPRTIRPLLAAAAAKVAVILAVRWYYHEHSRRFTTKSRSKQQNKDGGDHDENDKKSQASRAKSIREFEQVALQKMGVLAKVDFNHFNELPSLILAAGRAFLDSIRLLPTILNGDLSQIDTRLTLFEQSTLEIPVLIAPSAFHALATPDGEIATARGAGAAGAGYCYNWVLSSKPFDAVLREPGVKWLHICMLEKRDLLLATIKTAEATGQFTAIILTCDYLYTSVQSRIIPYCVQASFQYANSDDIIFPNQTAIGQDQATFRQVANPRLTEAQSEEKEAEEASSNRSSAAVGTNSSKLSWDDVKWIQSLTKLPIVVKGVLSASDARKAVESGVHAIVVSNHWHGYFAPPAMEALPAVVAAVKKRIPVFVEYDISSSADILKSLCLGASGILLGRPPLWALSCEGSVGLERMLQALKQDLQSDLRSLGVSSIQQLSMAHLWPPDQERIESLVQDCGLH